ncbi:hypothetical protein [Rhodobacter maris]|uniref:Type IV pilus biogenesis protein PilP n=1 Tax=Rhodobacter maris TaxID=446682 RepID=A0A285SBJ2_9RHOB|nr:hypothetical protein [Rhodobacter maris]SOC05024.1 hypothetical protein SAMN05877831_10493 [Rhodobacter maris]
MKPNFALNLSHDGISLFFRAKGGWELLGAVALDAPDFNDRLSALRRAAKARAGAVPVTSKLVIPASQVLYAEIAAPGPQAAARRGQIAAALEGRTPYAVDDLVFDWSGHGETVQVAVVARETLEEAEAFAEDRGFAPVSFVAVPEPGQFAGEPWFGPSAAAPVHLPDGARIERDQDPLPLSALTEIAASDAGPAEAREEPRDAPPVAPSVAQPDAPAEPAEPPEPEPMPEPVPAEALEAAPAPEVTSAETAPAAPEVKLEAPEPAETEAEAEAAATDAPEPEPLPLPPDGNAAASPQTAPQTAPEEAAPAGPDPVASAPAEPAPAQASAAEPAPTEPAPADPATDAADPAPAPATTAPIEAPRAAPVAAKPPRQPGAPRVPRSPPKTALIKPGLPELGPAPQPPASRPAPPARSAPAITSVTPIPAARATETASPTAPTAAAAKAAAPKPDRPPAKAPAKADVTAPSLTLPWEEEHSGGESLRQVAGKMAGAGLRRAAQSTAALGSSAGKALAVAREMRPRVEITPSASPETIDPERTVFGARKAPEVGGKPKHLGLMLGAALAIFLAIVGLWAGFLGDEPTELARAPQQEAPGSTAMQVPAPPAPEVAPEEAASAPGTAPAPSETPQAGPAEPVAVPGIVAHSDAAPETPLPPQTEAGAKTPDVLPGETAGDLAPSPVATEAAPIVVPGLAPLAPLGTTATAAFSSPAATAADLPEAPPAETVPETTPAIAPAVADELVPTREGVAAPGGFTLYAGKPPRVPRPRPDARISRAAEAARIAAEAPYADPALKRYHPKARPAKVEAAAKAAAEAPATAPPEAAPSRPLPPASYLDREGALMPTGPSPRLSTAQAAIVTKTQPKPRPQSVERAAAAAPVTAPAVETAEAAPASFPNASAQAVAVSRRPLARPRDFSAAVESALAAAIAAEPPPAAPAAIPPPAPAPAVAIAAAAPAPTPAPAPRRAAPSPAPEPTVFTSSEESSEPEPAAAAPKLPTTASVARQATQKNAIDLGEVTLIGLFGTPNNRRALVRLPNGRFYRVAVGDRLDGGKVTAIGETQMTYQKGSRPITLKLVRGG